MTKKKIYAEYGLSTTTEEMQQYLQTRVDVMLRAEYNKAREKNPSAQLRTCKIGLKTSDLGKKMKPLMLFLPMSVEKVRKDNGNNSMTEEEKKKLEEKIMSVFKTEEETRLVEIDELIAECFGPFRYNMEPGNLGYDLLQNNVNLHKIERNYMMKNINNVKLLQKFIVFRTMCDKNTSERFICIYLDPIAVLYQMAISDSVFGDGFDNFVVTVEADRCRWIRSEGSSDGNMEYYYRLYSKNPNKKRRDKLNNNNKKKKNKHWEQNYTETSMLLSSHDTNSLIEKSFK